MLIRLPLICFTTSAPNYSSSFMYILTKRNRKSSSLVNVATSGKCGSSAGLQIYPDFNALNNIQDNVLAIILISVWVSKIEEMT